LSSNISKIERVSAPQNSSLWVDLKLDKDAGTFFSDVGGERIRADTKAKAIEKTRAALQQLAQVDWREVIVIRIEKEGRGREDEAGVTNWENRMPVFGSSCSFSYMRRERASNPLKPKETIEREHREDFEKRVAEARRHAADFEWQKPLKKKKADEAEQTLRDDRSILTDAHNLWLHDHLIEHELPYSPEAWAGIRRIAQALIDTQAKLDEFAKGATPEKLAALATGDVFKQLPAPKP